jgi:two-component system sensor histidine kinase PilS (NtrC family)
MHAGWTGNVRGLILVRLLVILALGALLWGASRSGSLELEPVPLVGVLAALWLLTLLTWTGVRLGISMPVLLGSQVGLDVTLGTLLVGATGGVSSPLVLLYVVTIVTAGLFLGRRAAVAAAVAATVCWAGIAFLVGDGARLPADRAWWLVSIYAGAFTLLALLSGALAEHARRSREAAVSAGAELQRVLGSTERMLELMPIGLMTVGRDGRVARANRALCDLFGLLPGTAPVGEDAATFLESISPSLREALEASLLTGKWAVREEVVLPGERASRFLGVAFTPLVHPEDGQLDEVIVTCTDLSHARRMEDQMWKAEQLAQLGELAAGVAHEIRNPLASISGAAQMLRDVSAAGEEAELMDLIVSESERLNRIIDGVLDYTRDHSGTHAVHDVSLTAQEVVRLLRHDKALTIGKTVLTEFPECQSFLVEAEEGGMKQVFLNLARNALQAMDVGGILRISGQATDGRIYVVFKDSGDGIASHDLEHVFKPFHTTKAGGTGLGLPIAARIVEGNGGSIKVKSTPGVGTAFTVELPAAPGSSPALPAPKKEREAQPVEARHA